MSSSKLTGKQQKFVAEYLNGANFNATLAASRAGYKATSKHSFESIGSENLTRPAIKARIDEFFAGAKVSAEETLTELAKLARGNSKDKIRALALLSQHHGLLDGRWQTAAIDNKVEIVVKHRMTELIGEIEQDVAESDREKDQQWREIIAKYRHSPETIEALQLLRDVMAGKKKVDGTEAEPAKQAEPVPVEVEIIPPQRRLQSAPIERMMAEVPERRQIRCRHGNIGQCFIVDPGKPKCENWHDNGAWKFTARTF